MKIDRLYYTVEQLAEHWLISIDDILQLGFTSQLTFLTQADWEYPRTKLMLRGEHTGITAQELSNIYFAKEPFSEPGNAGETANGILKGEECIITYHPGLDRLIIDASEVKRFEREHPELAATDNIPKPNEKNTVFFSGRGFWYFVHRNSGRLYAIGRTGSNKYLLYPLHENEELKANADLFDFETAGFFYLDKIDRFTYEQTQNDSLVKQLTPCTDYNEVESTIADIGDSVQIGGQPINRDDCYFLIDGSRPFILNFDFTSLNQTRAIESPTEPRHEEAKKLSDNKTKPIPTTFNQTGNNEKKETFKKLRLASLQLFIDWLKIEVDRVNKNLPENEKIAFEPHNLNCTKLRLFYALRAWEKDRIKSKDRPLWNSKASDPWNSYRDVWDDPERIKILDVLGTNPGNSSKDGDIFKKINMEINDK